MLFRLEYSTSLMKSIVDVERFTGLNIHSFSFSQKYFRSALATSVYYLRIAKNSWENIRSTLKNRESLAQRIFPHLWYNTNIWEIPESIYIYISGKF